MLAERWLGKAIDVGRRGCSNGGEDGIVGMLDPIDGTRSFVPGAPLWGKLATPKIRMEPWPERSTSLPSVNVSWTASSARAAKLSQGEPRILVRHCTALHWPR